MKTFTTRLISTDSIESLSARNDVWMYYGLLAYYTTEEVCRMFLTVKRDPFNLIDLCKRLKTTLMARIDEADRFNLHRLRMERKNNYRLSFQLDVGNEKSWALLVDELILRAKALHQLWVASGGHRQMAEFHEKVRGSTGSKVDVAPGSLVVRPNYFINMRQETNESGPIEVKVVSMPPRETVTDITYNDEGNIASTTQVQRDAA